MNLLNFILLRKKTLISTFIVAMCMSYGMIFGMGVFPPNIKAIQVGEEVTFKSDAITLSGSLLHPSPGKKVPVVVFILGSGDVTYRKSWLETNTFPWHKKVADVFLKNDIAVFFYDKRGIGHSEGHWRDATFFDRASDVEAAMTYLSERPDIDAENMGLFGISQGGWISYIVASRSQNVSFLILSGAPSVSVKEQMFDDRLLHHIQKNPSQERIDEEIKRYRAWYTTKLKQPTKNDYIAKIIQFDPRRYISKISVPTLAFYGEKDLYVPPQDLKLRNQVGRPVPQGFFSIGNERRFVQQYRNSGNPNLTTFVLKGAGHSMEIVDENGKPQWDRGFADGFIEKLDIWIKRTIPNLSVLKNQKASIVSFRDYDSNKDPILKMKAGDLFHGFTVKSLKPVNNKFKLDLGNYTLVLEGEKILTGEVIYYRIGQSGGAGDGDQLMFKIDKPLFSRLRINPTRYYFKNRLVAEKMLGKPNEYTPVKIIVDQIELSGYPSEWDGPFIRIKKVVNQ